MRSSDDAGAATYHARGSEDGSMLAARACVLHTMYDVLLTAPCWQQGRVC